MASYTYEFIDLGDDHALGCKCCRFSEGVDLPVPKKLSDDEITKLAPGFSASIFKDWTKLNAVLKRFEGTIQKRWLKKTPKQRRDVLLKAWPEIPTTHRPDFQGFRKVMKNTPRSHTLPSSAFLWPYINLEDLQQRHHLLLFLNSRGRNLPGMFVTSDFNKAHLGSGWSEEPGAKYTYRMGLYGQNSPHRYGRLLTVDGAKRIKAHPVVHTPGRGLLILEIQEKIYGFLLSCAHLILHDVAPNQYLLAPSQSTPPQPDAASNDWPSLTTETLEGQYQLPQAIDIERLKRMVASRRISAEDHMWFLMEDPGYFLECMKEWKEHSEHAMDHDCHHCWRRAATSVISNAFTLFIFWHWIYRQFDRMEPMEVQLRRANYETLRFHPKDEKLWLALMNVLEDATFFPLVMLTQSMKASPRMRHCYYTPKSTITGSRLLKPVPTKLTDAERRVDLLFTAIISGDKRNLHSLSHLVSEAQYLLDSDPEASRLVDPYMLSSFIDLAMFTELSSRVQDIDPWAASMYTNTHLDSKAAMKGEEELMDLDMKMRAGLSKALGDDSIVDEAGIFINPLDGSFDYPIGKRYTEENVKQMQRAERLLDAIWMEIEVTLLHDFKMSPYNTILRRLFAPRKKQRTPDWMPPLVEPAKPPALADRSANIPRFGEGTSIVDPITPARSKVKIKTRGTPRSEPDTPVPATPASSAPEEPQPQVPVPKRALKVLTALFPLPGPQNHARTELAWEEFLQALNAIGLQPMKLYGSVWTFLPKKPEECRVVMGRSIQFHEPKEVRRGGKIPAAMVRTFGRRMRYAFGWEGGMFVAE